MYPLYNPQSSSDRDHSVLIDTGACRTVVRDSTVLSMFSTSGAKERFHSISGDVILANSVTVAQFTVGAIDLGKQHIYVVPSHVTSANVLGMDILSQLDFSYNASERRMGFRLPVPTTVTDANKVDVLTQYLKQLGTDVPVHYVMGMLPVHVDMALKEFTDHVDNILRMFKKGD